MISNQYYGRTKSGILISSIVIGLSFIFCAVILSHTVVRIKGQGQTISVTGAAFKPIVSDFALWSGQVSVTASTLDEAYAELKKDMATTEKFLADEGFAIDDYEVGTVSIYKSTNRDRVVTGFTLTQDVSIELYDVDRLTLVAKKSSSLIEEGVEFENYRLRYIFTGLNALKLEMIKAATENAKLRSEQLAQSTGKKVGAPRSARVGVFQIRPLHSQEVSDYGINDQYSIDKEIVCTVHINFQIE
jgi:hypothetical protein